jgi:hypothetical protein
MRRKISILFFLPAALMVAPIVAAAQPATTTASPEADFVPAGPIEPLPEPLASALAGIRAAALGAHIRFLASPALAGRGLGAPGLDAAAEYVAAGLALAGVAPLAAGDAEMTGYFQPVPLREITGAGGDVTVERRLPDTVETRTFASGVDCVFPAAAPQTLTAPVVFVGYGIDEPTLGHDDYRGFDVHGKIVLVLGGVPTGAEWHSAELAERYAGDEPRRRWAAKLDTARSAGALAVLGVENDMHEVKPADEKSAARHFFLPFTGDDPSRGSAPLLIRVSPSAAATFLAPLSETSTAAADAPRILSGVTATIRIAGHERVLTSRNVLGVIPGVDPELRNTAVVVGAHMDHLGEVSGVVYPGADDNASGVAALLRISELLAAMSERPRRTLVVAFWTGEEEGKLGSGRFVRHPLWPLERIAAYVNLDMIGHPWSMDEIRTLVRDAGLPNGDAFLAGLAPAEFAEVGLPPGVPVLAVALRRATRGTGLALHLDYTDGKNGGSDYRDFARAGVPFLRFFGDFFPAYHEPGDTAAALDPAQVERIARLAFATIWLLAN